MPGQQPRPFAPQIDRYTDLMTAKAIRLTLPNAVPERADKLTE